MIGGKVLHVSDDLHRQVQDLCQKTGISSAEWVDQAIRICLRVCKPRKPRYTVRQNDRLVGYTD